MAVDLARFPARVETDDGTVYDPCALVVDGPRVRLARRRPDQSAVELPARDDLTGFELLPNRDQELRFADGDVWQVGVGEGCACNSPLKSWFSQAVQAAQ